MNITEVDSRRDLPEKRKALKCTEVFLKYTPVYRHFNSNGTYIISRALLQGRTKKRQDDGTVYAGQPAVQLVSQAELSRLTSTAYAP